MSDFTYVSTGTDMFQIERSKLRETHCEVAPSTSRGTQGIEILESTMT